MFAHFEFPMEICILIVLTFALLAWCIGATVRRYRESRSESGFLKDEEFGFSSKVRKFFPKEEPESEDDEEEARLLHRASFWHCCSCDAEFRLPDGEIPSICPACGEQLVELPVGVEEDAAPYICPRCGPYFLLDGDDSETCPICGGDEIKEINGVNRCFASWGCSSCDQEFIVHGTPTRCPYCGEVFAGRKGEVDDDVTEYICSICGKKIEMMDGETAEYCAVCGEELGIE